MLRPPRDPDGNIIQPRKGDYATDKRKAADAATVRTKRRRDTIKRWTSQGRTPQQISAAMGWSVGVIEADLNAMKDFWTPPPLDPGTATVDVWPFENRGYRVKGPDGRWYLLQTPSGHVARCRAGEAGLPDVLHRNSVGGKARFAWTDGEMVAAIEYPITVLREKKVLDTESNG